MRGVDGTGRRPAYQGSGCQWDAVSAGYRTCAQSVEERAGNILHLIERLDDRIRRGYLGLAQRGVEGDRSLDVRLEFTATAVSRGDRQRPESERRDRFGV